MLLNRDFKLNKQLNKFYFYSARYWKGKIRSHLNDIFVVSFSFLFFFFFFFFFFLFNFHSVFLVLISILSYIVLTTYYIV